MVVGGIESLGELPDALQEALSQLGIDLDFPERPERTAHVRLTCPEGFYEELKANVLRSGGMIEDAHFVTGDGQVFAADTNGADGHSRKVRGDQPFEERDRLAEFERDESVVWKFRIPNRSGHFELELPVGAVCLDVQLQHGEPHVWALVEDASAPMETRRFSFQGTGKVIGEGAALDGYIGTVQMDGGHIVRHLFELETEG